MTAQPKIYHNPRCTKSRQTLQLLQDKGFTPEVVEYLDAGLTTREVTEILKLLKLSPREFMRKGEDAYKESGAEDAGLKDAALVKIISENPILFERPVVVYQGRAAIGRPPEQVLPILEKSQ